MNEGVPFVIDLTKPFPHLPAAPIIEAVIHWQARGTKEWDPDKLRDELKIRLPDYPKADLQHRLEVVFEARVDDTETPATTSHRKSLHGVRLESPTKKYIAQFSPDGLVFSHLEPYEEWALFSKEARRLWNVFVEIAAPSEIQRLGVRFINRISSAAFANLGEFLNEPPSFLSELPMSSFLYQSSFNVPGHALGINIVKTMQATIAGTPAEPGLIIDIDVFASKPLLCEDRILDDYLPKMQWVKNWVFFKLLTPKAIETFKRV